MRTTTHRLAGYVTAGLGAAALAAGFLAGPAAASGTDGTGQVDASVAAACTHVNTPRTCAQAVSWANSHIGKVSSDYNHLCDHVVGLAYGLSASGHTTAYTHWTSTPSRYKHAGDTNVPAGGLAFFGGGAGHVMISIGGGNFVSNDIVSPGKLSKTTIATIKSKWGKPYLGWTQPWF